LPWGRRAFHKKPGTITIEFLPLIAPGLPRREFMRSCAHGGASQRLAAADTGEACIRRR
jgi:1-acyl-sn-glycerol-3-phosphate acyltransferase